MRKPKLYSDSDEPEVREAKAQQAIDEVTELRRSPAWARVSEAIHSEVAARLSFLEKSSRDDEQHRGALEVLRTIQSWPDLLEQQAMAELTIHRGK